MKLRTISALCTAALVLALSCAATFAAEGHDAPATPVTVQGEILDLACYLAHEGKGAGHADCAAMCLKGGQPMGLLAKDGTVYLLLADHSDASPYAKAKDLAGKNVEVKGTAANRSGLKGITLTSVKGI